MRYFAFLVILISPFFMLSCSDTYNKDKHKNSVSVETTLNDKPIEHNVFAESTINEAFKHKKNKDEKALKKCFSNALKKKKSELKLANIKNIKINEITLETDLNKYNNFIATDLNEKINSIEDLKIYNVEYEIDYIKPSKNEENNSEAMKTYYLIKDSQGDWKITHIET